MVLPAATRALAAAAASTSARRGVQLVARRAAGRALKREVRESIDGGDPIGALSSSLPDTADSLGDLPL